MRTAAVSCRRCPLYRGATQTVFGEGSSDARLLLAGEQPGDQEDLAGRPFVGPAGRVLNEVLARAQIDRREIYLTNVVKHFKHELRGKRRLHKTPAAGEIEACRWWIDREIAAVRPRLIVALGGTAARSLAGRVVVLSRSRGLLLRFGEYPGLATLHPSAVLRAPDAGAHERLATQLAEDLALAAKLAAEMA